ncbi:MAG TPA: hypothetical protein VFP10_10340, partial [Candidatus Eisenbacteria bacterium]|nr:hypothetical protein [Candidatus Eisenbacteria bacterium]
MRLHLTARRRGAWLLGISALFCVTLLGGGRSQDLNVNAAYREQCSMDVALPLEVRVLPQGAPHPGAALRVRVEIEAFRDFADADLRILPPPDVSLLSSPRRPLGRLNVRKKVTEEFTVVVPA